MNNATTIKDQLQFWWKVITRSFTHFSEDDIFTHAAALSYYTIFSLPPMLLIILYTTTLFYDAETIKSALHEQISELVGVASAQELLLTIENLSVFQPTFWATALSIGILIFTSTTVFVTLQNALNKTFRVKPKITGWGILYLIKARVLSFSLVIGVAFILLVSLVVNALVESFGQYIEGLFGFVSFILTFMTTIILPFAINTLLFAMIFKFLPDAKLKWSNTLFGAILTSVLFVIGKYLISFYIGNSSVSGLYDAAGSVMVIMVWVFYASIIIMYGSVFTYSYLKEKEGRIKAEDYAVKVKFKEIEQPKKEVQ